MVLTRILRQTFLCVCMCEWCGWVWVSPSGLVCEWCGWVMWVGVGVSPSGLVQAFLLSICLWMSFTLSLYNRILSECTQALMCVAHFHLPLGVSMWNCLFVLFSFNVLLLMQTSCGTPEMDGVKGVWISCVLRSKIVSLHLCSDLAFIPCITFLKQ